MTRLYPIEERMLRGADSWFVPVLAGFFVVTAVLTLASGAADQTSVAADLLAATGLSLAFLGTRTGKPIVQRVGLALSVIWFVVSIVRWLG